MTRRVQAVLMAVGSLIALLSVGIGLFVQSSNYVRRAQAEGALERAREQKILSWIVERNPDATIKDFAAFPKVLLDGSAAAGVDYRLILAICDKESDMRPRAVSHAGAMGLCQLMPGTALLMAKSLGMADYEPPRIKAGKIESWGSLSDPKVNVLLGIEYFRLQVAKFGPTGTALQGYNRAPQSATAYWPHDRYPGEVALRLVTLVHTLPAPY